MNDSKSTFFCSWAYNISFPDGPQRKLTLLRTCLVWPQDVLIATVWHGLKTTWTHDVDLSHLTGIRGRGGHGLLVREGGPRSGRTGSRGGIWKINPLHAKFFRGNQTYTVWCRYNAVNFLTNIHKRHPIARPSGRGKGCLLWIQHLIDILSQFLQSFMQYLTILDLVITSLECIYILCHSSTLTWHRGMESFFVKDPPGLAYFT